MLFCWPIYAPVTINDALIYSIKSIRMFSLNVAKVRNVCGISKMIDFLNASSKILMSSKTFQ